MNLPKLNTIRMNNPTRRTPYDWGVEIMSILGLLGAFVPVLFYEKLDKEILIPIHYNMYGEVDGWGDSSNLIIQSLIALVLYLVFTVLERYYKKFNYVVPVTEQNADSLYRVGVQMMRHTKLVMLFLFAAVNNASFLTAIGNSYEVYDTIITIILSASILTVIVYMVKMAFLKNG